MNMIGVNLMMNNELDMFIESVCSSCRRTDCDGALISSARDSCKDYASWTHLPDQIKIKIFSKKLTDEIYLLEDLIHGAS